MTVSAAVPVRPPEPAAAVLLVTDEEKLLDALLRLAAAAGVTPVVAADSAALRAWPTVGLVFVGADQAAALAERHPARRDRVHLVTTGTATDSLFRSAVGLGAASVLELPAAEAWVVELLADAADGAAAPAVTIGVVGGCGGVGATTFACALAAIAATEGPTDRGASTAADGGTDRATLLIDADPLGCGAERVVGLEESSGIRWDALLGASGRLGSRALREALPRRGDLAVLAWPAQERCSLDVGTAREVLLAAQRGHRLVVLDLPRRLDEVTSWLMSACDSLVLVSRADLPAAAAAARMVGRIRDLAGEPFLVVRGRGAVPAEDLAGLLDLPLLAVLAEHRKLAEWLDLGLGPVHHGRGPCAAAARTALHRLLPGPVPSR